jgi:Beta-galactosidase jelly roll domain/Beta-galactosidase, domain 3
MTGEMLYITGDINTTTTLEIIGAPSYITDWYFNGQKVDYTAGIAPLLSGTVAYNPPNIDLPDLGTLNWTSIDSLPELSSSYDDSLWTNADLTYTNNTNRPNLGTPTSLYAADYGYNTGSLVYRGRFTATGSESSLNMELAGGEGFSASIWLNSTFIGSYAGNAADQLATISYPTPTLTVGISYVLNVLIDQTGFEESQTQGADLMKAPRGILSYDINGHSQSDVSWKLTGNLHGEAYEDQTRGPLNEGGLFAERQGYHLPDPPSSEWTSSSPLSGTSAPGVTFYS